MPTHEELIISVVKKTLPSVVSIVISKTLEELEKENPFQKFFGAMPYGYQPSPEEKEEFYHSLPRTEEGKVRIGGGSGFIALKNGITVLNSPGTIDSDYRGEIGVILLNTSKAAFTIARGERIAQMVIAGVAQARLIEVSDLPETDRGAGGFGSTGS